MAGAAAHLELPPGPSAPRTIQSLQWIVRPTAMMERLQRRYGDMFTVRLVHEGTWVFLSHPDAVKQVFTGDPRLLHAGEANVVLLPILGSSSVLLLDEAPHMAQRKLMLPPFHGERMLAYAETMADVTERELAGWPIGRPLTLLPRMQAITLEVIVRTVFGVSERERMERLQATLREVLDWGSNPRRIALLAAIGPERLARNRAWTSVRGAADELLFEEIRRRRSAPDLEERDDILSMLIQARDDDGRGMSDQELRDELMTLLVAGHETTASSLAWTLERLVRHPDKLERVRAEIEGGDDTYLDAVVKESLRLRPILAIVLRRLTEPMEIGGRLLPAGVAVAPCIYLVHRRPDIYPDPHSFLPERFLEQPAGTYTWFPFGGGIRRCIGASFALFELKTVLAGVISRLALRPADPRPERLVRRAITLVPDRGAEVIAEPVGSGAVKAPPPARAAAA
ncbi:MAG TPA: cytochrome P450 [Thermoleophilaceae bacterium]|nr:cytochrome P450 [Thermoleophilaceae bacterium]